MKKIILLSIFIIASLWFNNTYAEPWADSKKINVQVTEKMPWMDDCKPDVKWWHTDENPLYNCTIEPGFGSVQKMLSGMIKYFTFIAGIAGVLFLVVNGIMYSMWWMDPGMKDEAKKRISKTLVGLIVLFCSWIILNLVAPWIYK
jgi:hypothetical protein